MLAVLVGAPGPLAPRASAAGGVLNVSVQAVAPAVLSGDSMVWSIQYACIAGGDDCTGGKITVPIPSSVPDGIAPITSSTSGASASTDGTGGYVTSTSLTATSAVWTFATIPAGTSKTVVLTLVSKNIATPNGSTYTPVATFTSTNSATKVSNTDATVTVNSTAVVMITKSRYPVAAPVPPEPFAGDLVTYQISAGNKWPLTAPSGVQAIQNAVVTDTLPPTAIFQSAVMSSNENQWEPKSCTLNGSVGPATTPGGTVVCPAWSDIPDTSHNHRGVIVYVTVRYPVTQPAADTPLDQTDDGVTNSATITAEGILRPSYTVTATDTDTHGFRARTSGSPGVRVQKTNNSENTVYQGATTHWVNQSYNTGNVPLVVHFEDHFPCTYTSPTTGVDPCLPAANPALDIAVDYGWRAADQPITLTVTYADGTTDTHQWVFPKTTTSRTWIPAKAVVAAVWEYSLIPGETVTIYYTTRANGAELLVPMPVAKSTVGYQNLTAAMLADPNTYVENCLSNGWYTNPAAADPTAQKPIQWDLKLKCATKQVLAASPICTTNCGKFAVLNQSQAPGGTITFEVSMQNTGTAPMEPQILDLLPPQLSFVPGSVVYQYPTPTMAISNCRTGGGCSGFPNRLDMIVENIANYAGTGRELVRITWPAGDPLNNYSDLAVGSTIFRIRFQARVKPGVPSAQYTNTALIGDRYVSTLCARTGVADTLDLDGDGSKTDIQCPVSANFIVSPAGGVDITKAVMGDADTAFVGPPGVGHTSPTGHGEFKVTMTNSGSINLGKAIAYDILPYVGDSLILTSTQPRNTEWRPALTQVTAPADVQVSYSLSTNPCRGEVVTPGAATAAGPAGCVNDWTTTAPADLSTVRALRFETIGSALAPGEAREIVVGVQAPDDATGSAWNSSAIVGRTASGWLLPTENNAVALVVPIDLSLKKTITSTAPHLVGSTVSYRLSLANSGPGHATGVSVVDKLPAGLTYVDAVASQGSYDAATGVWTIGELQVDQTLTLDVHATVTANAVSGLVNFAQVQSAKQPDSDSTPANGKVSTPHEDDEAEVPLVITIPNPAVTLTKYVDGADANTAPGAAVRSGATVTWTYRVANTGNVPLIHLTVTDDQGALVTCPSTGDATIARLDPGASVDCTASGTAGAGAYVNVGTVEGTASDGNGTAISPARTVSSHDPAHSFGVDQAITLVKSINTDDANDSPGVLVQPGSTMSVTFLVTNTGNVALRELTVTDTVIPADQITCPATRLAVGAATTCTAQWPAPEVGTVHHDPATVVGTPSAADGSALVDQATGQPFATVTDTDPANAYVAAHPSVSIVKSINGDDANTAPGVLVVAGSTMAVSILVTNTGDVRLADLVVTDSVVPGSAISCPASSLAVGGSMTCTASWPAPAPGVTHVNTATVVGTPVDSQGLPVLDEQGRPAGTVRASDAAHAYTGAHPSVSIVKSINGDDANTAPGGLVPAKRPMAITMLVTNTGDVRLADLVVTDSVVPGSAISCSGSSLAVGGSMTCTASWPAPAPGSIHVNTATVVGTPVDSQGLPVLDEQGRPAVTVRASDAAHSYAGAHPSVSIVKSINGDDANTAPGVRVAAGSTLAIAMLVTNTGDVRLVDLVLTDTVVPGSGIACPATILEVGASMTCTATWPAPAAGELHRNTATVVGVPVTAEGAVPLDSQGAPLTTVTASDGAYATTEIPTPVPPMPLPVLPETGAVVPPWATAAAFLSVLAGATLAVAGVRARRR